MLEFKRSRTANNTIFDDIAFCTKALTKPKKDSRFFKNHLQVKNGVMNSTDGYRLHQWLKCPIDDGYYQVIKNTKTHIILNKVNDYNISYPDIDIVFKGLKNGKSEYVSIDNYGDVITVHAKIVRLLSDDLSIDPKFINDLIGNNFNYTIYEGFKPIIFKNDCKVAGIMPISIQEAREI